MAVGTYEWQSDFAREYVGIGREEGREEGAALGVARSVIAVLETRGFAPSSEVRERVEACTDLQTLDQWLRAAMKVDRPEDLFD